MTGSHRSERSAWLLGFALVLLLSGCRSSGSAQSTVQVLPFHVAIAPPLPTAFENRTLTSELEDGEQQPFLVDLEDFATSEDPQERVDVAAAIAAQLEGELFSKVTVLPEAPDEASSQTWYVDQARACHADLLLTINELSFDALPETKGKPWNWLWYSLGPFVYAFDDRSYHLDSTIEVALYDLNQIVAVGTERSEDGQVVEATFLLEPTDEMRRFRAESQWVSTKFHDRVEGGTIDYAKSLLIPTSLLRKGGLQVRRKVARLTLASMADVLAQKITVDAEFITRPAGRDSSLQLAESGDVPRPRLARIDELDGPGTHVVLDTVVRQPSFSADRDFEVARVKIGEQSFDLLAGSVGEFKSSIEVEPGAPEGWVNKRIHLAVPIDATFSIGSSGKPEVDPTMQLTFVDQYGEGHASSWTFRVNERDERALIQAMEASKPIGPVQPSDAVYHPR